MQVGLVACNDYIILESCIYRILQQHFRSHPSYAQILDLFHEVCCLSSSKAHVSACDAWVGQHDKSSYQDAASVQKIHRPMNAN